MVTKLVADLLGELNLNVREIHSRKPQSYRTRVSNEFRKSKGLILVTSDVSARGVDYPDVTLVLQVKSIRQYYKTLNSTSTRNFCFVYYRNLCTLYRWDCQKTENNMYTDLVEPGEKERKEKACCCWHHGRNTFYHLLKTYPSLSLLCHQ